MWEYLLKFSACLALLLLFYKLVLEKVHIHHFKRYYLLAAFVIAMGIPLITFTQYITVVGQPMAHQPIIDHYGSLQQLATPEEPHLLPIILWGIYGLGAAIFAIKFLLNLKNLIGCIHNNPKQRTGSILHVLLAEPIAPHTFFNYIFFNKRNYEHQEIPQEVFWHEETHARQKHSLDILLLELLQIALWFHPLVYWAKNLVKLNHEFLADQAVLNKGAIVPNYQNLVLAFSSNAITPSLANAIHYSSIKKRIIIMKTQTSQKAIWLKSLLLLPLLALLLYSFSTKEIEEIKQLKEEVLFPNTLKAQQSGQEIINEFNAQNTVEHEILILINKNGQLLIKNDLVKIEDLTSHLLRYNQNLSKEQRSQLVKSRIQIDKETPVNIIKKVEAILLDYGVATVDIDEYNQQKEATKSEIKEYNQLAKKYNDQPINKVVVKYKELQRLEYLYNRMSEAQRKSAQPFPNFPPPPPALPANAIEEEIKKHQRLIENHIERNHDHKITKEVIIIKKDRHAPKIKGEHPTLRKHALLPPPPPIPANATKEEIREYEIAIENYEKGKDGKILKKQDEDGNVYEVIVIDADNRIPPPPPPMVSPTEHFKELHQKGAKFYKDNKAISYGEALKVLKENKHLNIEVKETNGNQPTVKLSTKPIKQKNR
ncbi:Signal transducer regulating beta-lactamase production, contains metallopeptidase domain [Arenibacter nanhaiticus]|uniref:Signal transducer regulating beta-lactamase production, contains metallopeptidase domain n=1 Tax=Arenibacter nanhaiticus TaxID=558155 RepID=A0A1M6IPF1_9FLAO|nr:M56 family metallopeptidase [Arenibacter nanhaiticus]SHJ36288.1 Signal transducer regulating beta-lactamase production, contains metallopeptidase domain [Arenibacter nanhaiticus]